MSLALLIVIYIVFISLGLPDGLFGSAWPAIRDDMGAPLELGGVIAVLFTSMTIVSSLMTTAIVRRIGVGLLLAGSTALTIVSLIGFAYAPSVEWLLVLALPLGFGGGAIDSALNNYVANNYRAHHMNWLHAFWGVGATMGPVVFAMSLAAAGAWQAGYMNLGLIQLAILILIIASLPLWSMVRTRSKSTSQPTSDHRYIRLLSRPLTRLSVIAFALYVGVEVAIGLWLASYLVEVKALAFETASLWAGVYYGAITVGRVICGFIALRASDRVMVRYGLSLAAIGAVLLFAVPGVETSLAGIVLVGGGIAPIYPALIHTTPQRFGRAQSSKVMSLQMVGGYLGAAVIPPLIGLLSGQISMQVFAVAVPLLLAGVVLVTERINRIVARRQHQ